MLTHALLYRLPIKPYYSMLRSITVTLGICFFNNTKCAHLHFHFNPGTDTPTYYINNMEISKKLKQKI